MKQLFGEPYVIQPPMLHAKVTKDFQIGLTVEYAFSKQILKNEVL
jgi:hypothetical protein